jgi:hypothetical protein
MSDITAQVEGVFVVVEDNRSATHLTPNEALALSSKLIGAAIEAIEEMRRRRDASN